MPQLPSTARGSLVLALGAALLVAACDEKKPIADSPGPDAGARAEKFTTADPRLEKALQVAAAAASGASDNGPPPGGIFPPGAADRRHPKGAPTTVDVISAGSEPRVALIPEGGMPPTAARTSYGPAALEVGLQMGQRMALPTIDLALAIGPAKTDEGGADWLVADVRRALTAKDQLGPLPPGTDKEISTLEGTRVRIRLTPDGRESDVALELGKTSAAELERLAQNAAEALVLATVPLPPGAVGVGAQWIAETRMPLQGLDVIAYRAFHVKSIDSNRLHLSVDVKAYGTSEGASLPGVPPGAKFRQLDAQAQGEIELVRGENLARKSDVQERVVLVLEVPGDKQPPAEPGQPPRAGMMTAQLQGRSTFVRGEDLRAAQGVRPAKP